MADLRNPILIYLKGFLFLALGCMAFVMLLLLHPDWREAALLVVAIWSFSRFYYFAFYVIQHYVDPGYKFAGLGDFFLYLIRRRKGTS